MDKTVERRNPDGDEPSAPESFKPRCYIPWQEMIIGADGNVSPCSYYQGFGNALPHMGNANDQSISEIWNGPGYQRLREFMASDEGKNGCPNCLAIKQNLMGTPRLPLPHLMEEHKTCEAIRNAELMLDEVREKKTILRAKPTLISYTPSQKCNFRCTFCYQDYDHNLQLSRMKQIDEEILGLLPYLVQIIAGGGEPLILPIWRKFIHRYDQSVNPVLSFATTTNGSMLDEKMVEKLATFPSVVINFSIDATHKDLFEKLRENSNFSRVYDNLLRCLRRRGEATNSNFFVSGCMTVMKSNLAELTRMFKFMMSHKLTIGFSPLNVFPVDESLVCFNNPHAQLREMKAAFDEIELFFDEELYSNPEYDPFRSQALTGIQNLQRAVVVIKEMIPWHLSEIPHYPISARVPAGIAPDPNGKEPQVVSFFPVVDGVRQSVAYYAQLTEESFSVWLPEGVFDVGVHPRNVGAMPHPNWTVRIVKPARVSDQVFQEVAVRVALPLLLIAPYREQYGDLVATFFVSSGGVPVRCEHYSELRGAEIMANVQPGEYIVSVSDKNVAPSRMEAMPDLRDLRVYVKSDGDYYTSFGRSPDMVEVVRSASVCGDQRVSMFLMRSTIEDLPRVLRVAVELKIELSLSPICQIPVDEGLTTFNDVIWDLERWRLVLDECRSCLQALSISEQLRSAMCGSVSRLENLIPWHLSSSQTFAVEISVSKSLIRSFAELYHTDELVVVFFLENGPKPQYFATLREGRFSVHLPQGYYSFGICARLARPQPQVGWNFHVSESGSWSCSDVLQSYFSARAHTLTDSA